MTIRDFARIGFAAGLLLFTANGWGQSIVGSRHNLSVSGPGPIKSDTEGEICVFCHTPHWARTDTTFLWNRADPTETYITYTSSTLRAGELVEGKRRIGQPTGASALCLSCHDGTIALGAVQSREQEISFPVGIEFLTDGRLTSGPGYLGTDISDDHPVSFLYDEALATEHGELVSPSTLSAGVRLDWQGMMQCTACHDPHNDQHGKFLVLGNQYSALCTSCHAPTGWEDGAHGDSTAGWNGQNDDPWPHADFETVAENACANCHRPHKAGGRERLLTYASETAVCVVCHNGNVTQQDPPRNIVTELGKEFGHFVQNPNYVGIHDPAEDFSGAVEKHVACLSCHNPHRANADTAVAPFVSGPMQGVRGIDQDGNPVAAAEYLYEICFKCHSGANQFESGAYSIVRQDPEPDTRLAFATTNPSWHPVTGTQRFTDTSVPSLLAPYDEGGKTIYCTDCHNNNASGPKGPHGSIHPHLLAFNYTTDDNTPESALDYALCYRCHDRASILDTNNPSGFPHKTHVVDYQAPCSACHDPHGSTANTHLINFDLSIVSPPNALGPIEFVDDGQFAGTCSLTCHEANHDGWSYPPQP